MRCESSQEGRPPASERSSFRKADGCVRDSVGHLWVNLMKGLGEGVHCGPTAQMFTGSQRPTTQWRSGGHKIGMVRGRVVCLRGLLHQRLWFSKAAQGTDSRAATTGGAGFPDGAQPRQAKPSGCFKASPHALASTSCQLSCPHRNPPS